MNAIFSVCLCVAGFFMAIVAEPAMAAILSSGTSSDTQTSIGYNPMTGEVFIDTPTGVSLTSFRVESAASIFTGEPAQNLVLPPAGFDRDDDDVLFKSTIGSSFVSLSFGNVAQIGLSEAFLLNDWSVIGSLDGGGGLGDVDLIYAAQVPEPTGVSISALLLCIVACWRGWHRHTPRG